MVAFYVKGDCSRHISGDRGGDNILILIISDNCGSKRIFTKNDHERGCAMLISSFCWCMKYYLYLCGLIIEKILQLYLLGVYLAMINTMFSFSKNVVSLGLHGSRVSPWHLYLITT